MMKTIEQPNPTVDPVIAEVREHKRMIAAEFGFDVVALGQSLRSREAGDPRFQSPRDFIFIPEKKI